MFKLSMILVSMFTWNSWAILGNPTAPKVGSFAQVFNAEPETLNPITSTDFYASQIQAYVLDSLLTRNEDTYDWDPSLAESFTVSKDGTEFTFKIRKGVTWTDGKPLTAEDVKFSFDVIFDPGYPTAQKRPYFEGIKEVTIIDENTVKFKTKDVYFKNFETAATLTVVPKHIYQNAKEGVKLNKTLLGTGPYMLDSYEKGKRIVLKRNPTWWGNNLDFKKGQFNFEKMTYRFGATGTIAVEMLKKGDVDYYELAVDDYVEKTKGEEWGKKVFKVRAKNDAPKRFNFIGWNYLSPILKEKKARVALYHLVNRKLMIEKFKYGMSEMATGPWDLTSEYASKKIKPIQFDPKKAAALLAEIGWKDSDKDGVLDKEIGGQKTAFKISLFYPNPDYGKYLTIFQEDAKKVGIAIELKMMEWNSFIKILDEKKFDAVMLGWSGGSVDVDPKQIWHSTSTGPGGSNFISYNNPDVDKLIDQSRTIMDKKKRIPVLQKTYELIANDAPYVFLFNTPDVFYGHTKKVAKVKDTYGFDIGLNFWWETAL